MSNSHLAGSLPRYQKLTPSEEPQTASWFFRVTLIVLCVLGITLTALNTGVGVFVSPQGSGLGLIFTVIYAAIGLWAAHLAPIWPKRTPKSFQFWWVAACLAWGGGVCLLFSLFFSDPLVELIQRSGWENSLMSWGGAYPEEISKAIGVAVILLSFKHLTRPWHGAMTGLLIGLGFETNENIGYGGFGATADPNSDIMGTLSVWGARMVAGVGLHMVTTAIAGWGIGWAIFSTRHSLGRRIGVALGWFLLAFAIHFAWNYVGFGPFAEIAKAVVISIIMYGTFIYLFSRGNDMARAERTGPCTPRSLESARTAEAAQSYSETPYTRSKVAETSSAKLSTD